MPVFQDYYNHAKDVLKRRSTLYSPTYERLQTGTRELVAGDYVSNDPTEISFNFGTDITRFDLPTARESRIYVWLKAYPIPHSSKALLLINIESHNKTISPHHRFNRTGVGYLIEAEDIPETMTSLGGYLEGAGFSLSPSQFQRKRQIQFAPEAPEPKALPVPAPSPNGP